MTVYFFQLSSKHLYFLVNPQMVEVVITQVLNIR